MNTESSVSDKTRTRKGGVVELFTGIAAVLIGVFLQFTQVFSGTAQRISSNLSESLGAIGTIAGKIIGLIIITFPSLVALGGIVMIFSAIKHIITGKNDLPHKKT